MINISTKEQKEYKIRKIIREELEKDKTNIEKVTLETVEDIIRFNSTFKELLENINSELESGNIEIVKEVDTEPVQYTKIYKSTFEKKEAMKESLIKQREHLIELIERTEIALGIFKRTKYNRVIGLRYYEDKTLEEISNITNLSIEKVQKELETGLRMLRQLIFSKKINKK